MNVTSARALALAVLLAASEARAIEPWTSEDGESSLEVRSFYKTFWTALRMPHAFVDATEASAPTPDIPLYGLTTAYTGRIWSTLSLVDRVELQAGWQVDALAATDRAFLRGATLATPVVDRASRRLVDFDPMLAEEERLLVQHNLDLLSVKLRASFADVIVGRQVMSWGSGRLWNPTDLLSPFAPTDIDREVRRGVDAVRVSIPLASTAQLELLYLPQLEPEDQGAVVRAQSNIAGFDIAPSVAKYLRDIVFGFDVSGDIGPVGIHGELAWTTTLDAEERFLRAVGGFDVRPIEELVLTAEYYFNGWGAHDPSGYLDVLRSDRVARGEVFGAGRHYLGLVAAWQVSELVTLNTVTITNLQDPSVIIIPALEYWAHQDILLRIGNYVPLGRAPTPVLPDLGLRSEYGASPFGFFAQLTVHLL